jgi:hypothetical protein
MKKYESGPKTASPIISAVALWIAVDARPFGC